MKKSHNVLLSNSKDLINNSVNSLKKDGIVVLRGLFQKEVLSEIDKNWDLNFKYPSLSGTIGYFRTSHAKAVLPLFLLGKSALKVALEKKVITIIESYMKSKCTLAEANAVWHKPTNYVYFPVHSDFAEGWKKSDNSKYELSKKDIRSPVGVGAILYLHDTKAGAFKYSLGSHKLFSKYGQHLKNYPERMRETINNNTVICTGKKGDLILFDDRGFHGPDQPSKKDRSVLLLDYYRNKTFGHVLVTPHIIKITDISFLDATQLRVLGLGAKEMVKREEYVSTRFKNNYFYKALAWCIDNAYFYTHVKALLKLKLRKRIR